MTQAVNVTTPVGRLVRGSLYKGNDKDAEGKPLVIKSGPNAGQPRLDYFFAVAIPKGVEQHWAQTAWGAEIWKVGHAAFPQAAQAPSFAWKVVDGDSQVPNKKGKKPCDNEGYKGHWVVHFSSGYPTNVYKLRPGTRDQYDPYPDPDAIKLGHYVQVNFTCAGNGSQSQPGVFLNHRMVAFSAYGTEIAVGPDASAAGFGNAALPAGATMTPPPGAFNGASATPPAPGVPGAMPPPPGVAAPAPLIPGAVAAPPAVMAPPPVAQGLQMTAAANGQTYEAYRAAGWSDEQMIAQGVAVRPLAAPPAAVPGMPPSPPTTIAPAPAVPGAPIAHAPTVVTPNAQFVQVPGAALPPPPGVVAPPAVAGLVMTAAANGQTYDAYRAAGWSDEQMIAQGVAIRAA